MKLARYHGGGVVRIDEEPEPTLGSGGLLVQTEACGLCSGELMDWYMDRKIPHVLGHEVAGRVIASEDARFPVGARVYPHHHAPCGVCESCRRGHPVHCATWRSTRLRPGGMADRFAVDAANLADTHRVDDLDPRDAALIEPLACVEKSLRLARWTPEDRVAVIGLGVMGLLHLLRVQGFAAWGVDPRADRRAWAESQGLDAREPEHAPSEQADVVIVCPGSEAALRTGMRLAAPGGRVVLFAPMPPGAATSVPLHEIYFRDLSLINAYSCGPADSRAAIASLRAGMVRATAVVSHFIPLNELPEAYLAMKRAEILKPMVVWA